MNNTCIIGDATLYCGDVLECLAALPDESVHCCVTSPPYWGLRDYGVPGMIGLEPTFQEWLDKMVAVCREIRRVLRKDGTFWLNCGDCYANPSQPGGGDPTIKNRNIGDKKYPLKPLSGFKAKDLLLMPARLAIALQTDGWWVRSEIIWAKPNPMPESVTDRPTSAHEKIYLLTKSAKYFYDADAVRERSLYPHDNRGARVAEEHKRFPTDKINGIRDSGIYENRNLRNVWTIATQPYSEAHFASFPEALPMKCIMAGSRKGDTILDPFSGAATTGLVALKLDRRYIGIELNPDYIAMSIKRIEMEARQERLFT